MNILFFWPFTPDPHKGGVERVTHTWLNYYRNHPELNIQVFSVSLEQTGDEPMMHYTLPNSRKLYSSENVIYLSELVRILKIDIVLNQFAEEPGAALLFSKVRESYPIKIVSVLHSHPFFPVHALTNSLSQKYCIQSSIGKIRYAYHLAKGKRKIKKRFQQSFLLSDRYVVLTKDYGEYFTSKHYKKSEIKLSVIPNPTPFIVDSTNMQDHKQILFVGRLSEYPKRTSLLLDIWEKLEPRFRDWQLAIVGDGPDKNILIEQVNKKGLKQVCFYPAQNPTSFYRNSSVLCLTSDTEGLPMVQLESLQFGLAQIAFGTYEAVNDVIEDSKNGFIIPPGEVDNYAYKLSLILTNFSLRNDFRQHSIQVGARFTCSQIAEKWMILFRETVT